MLPSSPTSSRPNDSSPPIATSLVTLERFEPSRFTMPVTGSALDAARVRFRELHRGRVVGSQHLFLDGQSPPPPTRHFPPCMLPRSQAPGKMASSSHRPASLHGFARGRPIRTRSVDVDGNGTATMVNVAALAASKYQSALPVTLPSATHARNESSARESGCGCRVVDGTSASGPLWVYLGLVLAALKRRRVWT